ncbi:hypothetical protein ACFE04_022348 [Oxalis oulophora]
MLVGDSLSNNMWVSLACMLHASVPNANYNITLRGSLSTFSLQDYGVSLMWLKNGFLVDMAHEKVGKVLKLDSISRGEQWLEADMLIFNSFHWWTHTGRQKTWDYFQVGDKLVQEMDRMEAYRIALTTWSKWVDDHIDTSKIQVFYQGIAPVHYNGNEWKETNKTCEGETEPVKGSIYPTPPLEGEKIVKNVIGKMSKPVYLLDVSLLSQLRKDGHPSIYTIKGSTYNDCSHWCLAGVPDTWNHLLYAALISSR